MGYSILVSPAAQLHISDAADYYYNKASIDIVMVFYDDLQYCYEALEKNPFFQVRIKTYRALPMRKFPFLIFFEVIESEMKVRILAVFNTYQDEKKWP